ncbi:hypothetical protein VIBNISOn1_1840091 [Vibrio nigripulchritudo SOn1]|uniref:Uncharacterized protein n=1 Tax=Vibrio nigripulchritudo SOn1 TaxID=1238450 RepID=A0AAV2VQJ1_9VIBR|nr:hypothetical protein VIBNISOn1_1840091 [Vibrio nigripulchritudo SOn1]
MINFQEHLYKNIWDYYASFLGFIHPNINRWQSLMNKLLRVPFSFLSLAL